MRNRRIATLGLAMVVAVSLTGCSALDTIGSLGTEAVLNAELGSLARTLEGIPGVDDADYVLDLQADLTYTVGMTASSSGLLEEDAQAVLAAVTTTFASETLASQASLQFWVAGDDARPILGVSDWLTFPTEVIPDEIAYLYALQDAAGVDLSMSLSAPSDAEVDYYRNISSLELPGSAGLAAARQVADTSAEGRGWSFDGVTMEGAIYPVKIEPVAVLAAAIEGVQLYWNDEFARFDLSFDPSAPGDLESLDEWPALLELLRAASAPGLGFSLLQVSQEDGTSLTLQTGACAQPEGSAEDAELSAQFAAAGIQLSPAYCTP